MLTTLAIANYRSLRNVIIPLQRLNLITGPNGSGKSNVYRALRLLAETALHEKYICGGDRLPQRRQGAKKSFKNAVALCAFASLRER